MINKKKICVLLFIVFFSNASIVVAGLKFNSDELDKVFITTELVGNKSVVPNQLITVRYSLYTQTYFTEASEVSFPALDGLLILKPEITSGVGYLGDKQMARQQLDFKIYPTRSGIFEIPPINFNVYTAVKETIKTYATSVKSDVLLVLCNKPKEFKNSYSVIATPNLEVNDEWDIPKKIEKGSIIRRTLTLKAQDVAAMVLPVFKIDEVKGLTIFISDPSLKTESGRNGDYGILKQTVSYSVDKAKDYSLGGETIKWIKTGESNSLEEVHLDQKVISTSGALVINWKLLLSICLIATILIYIVRLIFKFRNRSKNKLKRRLKSSSANEFIPISYKWLDLYGSDSTKFSILNEVKTSNQWESFLRSRYAGSASQIQNWNAIKKELVKDVLR